MRQMLSSHSRTVSCASCRTEIPARTVGAISSAQAVQALREILIKHARREVSEKRRGQSQRMALTEGPAWIEAPSEIP